MAQWQNLLERVLGGHADHNIRFSVLRGLLRRLGFDERIRGDHHIFTRAGVREILDLQPETRWQGQELSGQAGA